MRTANKLIEKQFNPNYSLMTKTTYMQVLAQLVEFIHPKRTQIKFYNCLAINGRGSSFTLSAEPVKNDSP